MNSIATDVTRIAPGTQAVLKSIEGDSVIVERLSELGFVPGETVYLRRRLIFNGPLIVEVRGVPVALRAEEASCLRVEGRTSP